MPSPLPLDVRKRLAELILEAFDSGQARATLVALVAACQGSALEPAAAARLAELGWFAGTGDGGVRWRGAYQAHREAVCRRAASAVRMLEVAEPAAAGGMPIARLARAARLADAGLLFEVHELLEPAWLRADGLERLALQGLIQIAVGFHHAEHGNPRGAISLLAEGLEKLEASGSALPLDTAAWLTGLRALLAAWQAGRPAPAPTPWPAPTEAAWRCS